MPEKTLRDLERELQRLKNRKRECASKMNVNPTVFYAAGKAFDKRITEIEAMITSEKL